MIAIINIGGGNPDDPGGWRDYVVQINHRVVARFQHKRSEGLAECLRKAAKAVDEAAEIEKNKWVTEYMKESR